MAGPAVEQASLLLGGVVLVAFAIESAIGFGAMLVTVSLGSTLLGLDALLAAVVPLNVGLSMYVTGRYFRDVDRALFAKKIVPAMLIGMPAGLMALARLDPRWLKGALGVFVTVVAIVELTKRRSDDAPKALPRAVGWLLLMLAGVFHGAFSTGGPLAVYVLGRELTEKRRFRATLSALWLVLGLVLATTYAVQGTLGKPSLLVSLSLLIPAAVGTALGEIIHRRVAQATFQRTVFVLLAVVGVVLVVKSAAS